MLRREGDYASKKTREPERGSLDQLYEQLYKKNFKKQYAGKPTKKHLKLTQQIQKTERIPYHEIERVLLN